MLKKRICLLLMFVFLAVGILGACTNDDKTIDAIKVDIDPGNTSPLTTYDPTYTQDDGNHENQPDSAESQTPNDEMTQGTTSAPSDTNGPKGDDTSKDTEFVTLELGSKGDDVQSVQERLIELGYLHTKATGTYAEKTVEAVEAFQKQNKIPVTGKVDVKTRDVLFSKEAVACKLPLSGYIIGLDPGHQSKSNPDLEPVAPGSDEMKKKVSSGTEGRYTKVPEYKVNLTVALLLRDLLIEQGATVVMTRETNDVNISNIERAQFFNEKKTDYALRLHCNGSDNTSKQGAFMLVPTENPYLDRCKLAAQLLIDAYCRATGAKNLGLTYRSDQTGFNWCERMIVNIEMGHMSNEEEDYKLTDPDYQQKMARGLLYGILAYFENID